MLITSCTWSDLLKERLHAFKEEIWFILPSYHQPALQISLKTRSNMGPDRNVTGRIIRQLPDFSRREIWCSQLHSGNASRLLAHPSLVQLFLRTVSGSASHQRQLKAVTTSNFDEWGPVSCMRGLIIVAAFRQALLSKSKPS